MEKTENSLQKNKNGRVLRERETEVFSDALLSSTNARTISPSPSHAQSDLMGMNRKRKTQSKRSLQRRNEKNDKKRRKSVPE